MSDIQNRELDPQSEEAKTRGKDKPARNYWRIGIQIVIIASIGGLFFVLAAYGAVVFIHKYVSRFVPL